MAERVPCALLYTSPVLALFALLALQAASEAQQLLDQGINAYEAMELDLAQSRLSEAAEVATDDERARIELWRGVVELERGADDAARRHLRAALQHNPRLLVPRSLSPKVHALIEELRPSRAPPRAARPPARAPEPPAPPPPAPAAPSSRADEGAAPVATAVPQPAPGPAQPQASPGVKDAEPTGGEAPVSPFLVVGAGSAALAGAALAGALGLGVSAKLLEGEAQAAPRAETATAQYEQAAGNALVANALFIGSGVAAAGGAIGLGLWFAEGAAE